MGLLHWPDEMVRIRTFSSTGKAGSTIVKIELVTSDHREAGWLMDSIAREQRDAEAARKAAARKPKQPDRAAPATRCLSAPLLALPAPERYSHE